MSCQPSPSKSATQTPGPNSSRLMEMPLLPLKWTILMPAAAVVFVNWMKAGGDACAWLEVPRTPGSTHSRTNPANRSWARTHRYSGRNRFAPWRSRPDCRADICKTRSEPVTDSRDVVSPVTSSTRPSLASSASRFKLRVQRDFKEYHVDCMHARDHRLMPFALRILVLLLSAGLVAARAEVRVWQGTMLLPTYEEGPPDPNPPFDLFATSRFHYPYTLRNNLTGRRDAHEWRAIYLENEYLNGSGLRDIGAHLYTCGEKINGQPIFYANPSIKKAEIG